MVVVSSGRTQGTPPGLEEAALGEQEPGSLGYLWSPGVHTCRASDLCHGGCSCTKV